MARRSNGVSTVTLTYWRVSGSRVRVARTVRGAVRARVSSVRKKGEEARMKEKLILVGSVLVGLLAFWLTHRYIQAERAKLYEQVQPTVSQAQHQR